MSATATIRHRVSETVGSETTEDADVPFISQIPESPLEVFRQRRSTRPSPLKSPAPWISHAGSATVGRATTEETEVPFISQIPASPFAALRQIRSLDPVPSKSLRFVRTDSLNEVAKLPTN